MSEKENKTNWSAFGLVAMVSGYIAVPLLLFLALGYFVGKSTGHPKLSLGLSLVPAFIISNFLLFRKAFKIGSDLNEKDKGKASEPKQ